jgi:hypothetical protein
MARAFAFFVAFDTFAIAGPPGGELGRAETRLVGRDGAVGQRDNSEHEEEHPQTGVRAHQQIAEEEERHPLELLAEASEGFEKALGVRVERVHQDESGEGEHPPGQRRQADRLLGDEQPAISSVNEGCGTATAIAIASATVTSTAAPASAAS